MKLKAIVVLFILCSGCSIHQNKSELPVYSGERELPMYGGGREPFTKSFSLDELKTCKTSSSEFSKLGWEYFYKNDFNTAMKRFNQAWLFNPENAEVWWGFGLIMGIRAENEEKIDFLNDAVKYLEKALMLDKWNTKIMIDLAITHTKFGQYMKILNKEGFDLQFSEADSLFVKVQKEDASFPPLWLNWAYLKYYRKDYIAAYQYISKAKELGCKVPEKFISDLNKAAGH